MFKYQSIKQLLLLIDEPNGSKCLQILDENQEKFNSTPGSTNNHQAWPGGYLDHICEVMNIAIPLYLRLNTLRPLSFTLSDALLILFLHDIEKPWKYKPGTDQQLDTVESLISKEAQHQFRADFVKKYELQLTDDHWNGLRYVEGELHEYSGRKRVMGPLAAFCHLADVTSARIWFDYPNDNDPWK